MRLHIAVLACFLVLVIGCARAPKTTAEVPRHLSMSYRVSVAPFTQPRTTSELIAGNLPEPQGVILEEDLRQLDVALRRVLSQSATKRNYRYLTTMPLTQSYAVHSGAQPAGLSTWIAYGKAHKAQVLLVPYVLHWHEREGSKAGVTHSAEVRVEFFLLNIDAGSLMARSVFDEKQRSLTENFLEIASFVKRKGAWVSATDLAVEGMQKAKNEFGL